MKVVECVTEELSELIEMVNQHSLYSKIKTLADLRLFMECHVFCVWDFMCLLKELQRRLVSTRAPWFPPENTESAHLINSILVEEEGDLTENGNRYLCHFDLYLVAMRQIGADTQSIQNLLCHLKQGYSLKIAIQQPAIPLPARQFVTTTFSFFTRPSPEIAAAFVYGREAITGKMFMPLISQLKSVIPVEQQSQLNAFIYYCRRHIELDQADHLPKAMTMLAHLIQFNSENHITVIKAARQALIARLDFLTGIERLIKATC